MQLTFCTCSIKESSFLTARVTSGGRCTLFCTLFCLVKDPTLHFLSPLTEFRKPDDLCWRIGPSEGFITATHTWTSPKSHSVNAELKKKKRKRNWEESELCICSCAQCSVEILSSPSGVSRETSGSHFAGLLLLGVSCRLNFWIYSCCVAGKELKPLYNFFFFFGGVKISEQN